MRFKQEKTSNSFEFTCFWADAHNRVIPDLIDFTKTFFAEATILNIPYAVLYFYIGEYADGDATDQLGQPSGPLNRIEVPATFKVPETAGYIWHTTGSRKTVTFFKTAKVRLTPYGRQGAVRG